MAELTKLAQLIGDITNITGPKDPAVSLKQRSLIGIGPTNLLENQILVTHAQNSISIIH